jgi:WD40 repeat protein
MKNQRAILILTVLIFTILACSLSSCSSSITDTMGGMGVPLPPDEAYGVLCFVEVEDAIIANAPVFEIYYSQDGGLNWLLEGFDFSGFSGSDCSPNKTLPKELWVTPDGQVRYRFNPGESVEISTDQGQSWVMAYDLTNFNWEPVTPPEADREVIIQPGPLDAMIDPRSGNLLLAMGHAGILVGLPNGEWRWVSAGSYSLEAVSLDQLSDSEVEGIEETVLLPLSTLVAQDVEIDMENNYVNALAFAPNNSVLAVSGFEGGIKLYDFRRGDLLHWQEWGQDVQHRKLYGAVFSSDSKSMVTCGTNVDQTLRFWNVDSWAQINVYEGYQTSAIDVGIYGGDQFFAVAFRKDPAVTDQVHIFSLPEGELITILNSHFGDVSSVLLIPGSRLLAIGSSSGGVEIWDYAQVERLASFYANGKGDGPAAIYQKIHTLGYDPIDNLLMALTGEGKLTGWDISTGGISRQLALAIPHGWYISSSAISEDGSLVAVGMQNGPLLLFDSRSGQVFSRQWIEDGGTLMQLGFSPQGDWLAAGFANGRVKLWRVEGLIE